MLKNLSELKIGDSLTHFKTKEKYILGQIIPKEEDEGTNYYFPKLGYVRDKVMRKMFVMENPSHFIVD
jgi:hypothetical protein